jgi:hypothetical protein
MMMQAGVSASCYKNITGKSVKSFVDFAHHAHCETKSIATASMFSLLLLMVYYSES